MNSKHGGNANHPYMQHSFYPNGCICNNKTVKKSVHGGFDDENFVVTTSLSQDVARPFASNNCSVDTVSSQVTRKAATTICCFSNKTLRNTTIGLALFEAFVFTYQLIITTFNYYHQTSHHMQRYLASPHANTRNPSTSEWGLEKFEHKSFALTLLCLGLGVISIILLAIGIQRRFPYLILPFIITQVVLCFSLAILCGYISLLILGGTSIQFWYVVFEDSIEGYKGLMQSLTHPYGHETVVTPMLNIVLWSFLVFTAIVFLIELLLSVAVFFYYRRVLHHNQLISYKLNPTYAAEKPLFFFCS